MIHVPITTATILVRERGEKNEYVIMADSVNFIIIQKHQRPTTKNE